jgi:hypothetical protein
MSDEQANEVIRVRHRLRALAIGGGQDVASDAQVALEQLRSLSERLADPDLVFEHARWRGQFDHLALKAPAS